MQFIGNCYLVPLTGDKQHIDSKINADKSRNKVISSKISQFSTLQDTKNLCNMHLIKTRKVACSVFFLFFVFDPMSKALL